MVDHLAGLVPLRGPFAGTGTRLVGRRPVSGDRGDLLALVLLVDGALRLVPRVAPRGPVGAASLGRVAMCSVATEGETFAIADAVRDDGSVSLSERWRHWVAFGGRTRAQIAWDALSSASPGCQALLWALATERAPSVSVEALAKRCGSQVTAPFKRAQQIRRWLHGLGEAVSEWRVQGETVVRLAPGQK